MIIVRIIARLDIKRESLIKSIMFEGVRSLGCPKTISEKYYNSGIDELILVNNTGSLYNTKLNLEVLKSIRKNKFLPITVSLLISFLENSSVAPG